MLDIMTITINRRERYRQLEAKMIQDKDEGLRLGLSARDTVSSALPSKHVGKATP
jgi:hypothetical protein